MFDYLESRKFRTVVALDEFQQIAEYPEKGAEALLRSRIQFLTGNRFIFSGSRQHMMAEMFVSAKRPFYHSTQLMHIGRSAVEGARKGWRREGTERRRIHRKAFV